MSYKAIGHQQFHESALVVCAGTVTCTTVEGMGSGFLLFKRLFSDDILLVEGGGYGRWTKKLQETLDNFHNHKKPMPAYQALAKHENLLGAIATVPVYSNKIGLNPSIKSPTDDELIAQYKEALRAAFQDAKDRLRPLVIQPLGIGVYGWDPNLAAQLTHEVIQEVDPNHELDVSILIFDQAQGSKDWQFQAELKRLMGEPLVIEQRIPSQARPVMDQKSSSELHTKLISIIETLTSNIENAQHRWTSGKGSDKVIKLKNIQQDLINKPHQDIERYIDNIRQICKEKRNPWHFWHTPASVNEFEKLLEKHGLNKISPPKKTR